MNQKRPDHQTFPDVLPTVLQHSETRGEAAVNMKTGQCTTQLSHSPNAPDWTNVLTLAYMELLLSLPVSNGRLEKVFLITCMQSIEMEKQSSMSNKTLDDLHVAINVNEVTQIPILVVIQTLIF